MNTFCLAEHPPGHSSANPLKTPALACSPSSLSSVPFAHSSQMHASFCSTAKCAKNRSLTHCDRAIPNVQKVPLPCRLPTSPVTLWPSGQSSSTGVSLCPSLLHADGDRAPLCRPGFPVHWLLAWNGQRSVPLYRLPQPQPLAANCPFFLFPSHLLPI